METLDSQDQPPALVSQILEPLEALEVLKRKRLNLVQEKLFRLLGRKTKLENDIYSLVSAGGPTLADGERWRASFGSCPRTQAGGPQGPPTWQHQRCEPSIP